MVDPIFDYQFRLILIGKIFLAVNLKNKIVGSAKILGWFFRIVIDFQASPKPYLIAKPQPQMAEFISVGKFFDC